jgi:hypothetical protein
VGEERLDPLPPVVGGGDAIGGTVDGEEGVAGIVVAVELVGSSRRLQDALQLVDGLRTRVGVVATEQLEQRTGQIRQLPSGTPPAARAVAAASSGAAPGASRKYRLGQIASQPSSANRRTIS